MKSTRIIINVSFLRAAGTRAIIGIIFDDSISKKKNTKSFSVPDVLFGSFHFDVVTYYNTCTVYLYIYIYRNMSKRAVVT